MRWTLAIGYSFKNLGSSQKTFHPIVFQAVYGSA